MYREVIIMKPAMLILVALLLGWPANSASGSEVVAAPGIPMVRVTDQPIVNDFLMIAEVVSDGPGWIVIHADADGKPGPIIGRSAVIDGTNRDVMVAVLSSNATDMLYAMLHIDEGNIGIYEFPGPDLPEMVNGAVISPAFNITG